MLELIEKGTHWPILLLPGSHSLADCFLRRIGTGAAPYFVTTTLCRRYDWWCSGILD